MSITTTSLMFLLLMMTIVTTPRLSLRLMMTIVTTLRLMMQGVLTKGLFTNYVISKLTSKVLQIMTQHDAIYQVWSLVMMNDGPSLLSLELALK